MKLMYKYILVILLLGFLSNFGVGQEEESEEGFSNGAPMEKSEQVALYLAIQGFVGNWWNGSDLYPDPCGWTPIQGVSCDIYNGLWYVTSLSVGPIHENSLECETNLQFRPELFKLKHLKSLTFFNCFTSLQHPITIENENWVNLADSLESLELRSNPGLIGKVPVSFSGLTKLQSLVMLENGLTGELPLNVGNLTSMKRLVVAGNSLTGPVPFTLGGLSDLLILDLSRNSLTGPLPATLGGLASLLKLDLSNNKLHGKLPAELGFLKSLTLLDIRNNPLGGDIMSIEWKNLQSLEILDLSSAGLVRKIPESLSELIKLRFLDLSNNKLSGTIPTKLEALPIISALYLNNNNFSGEIKFSYRFYEKIGRRFSAWNNPKLCYSVGLMSQSSSRHVPHGVNQCQITLVEAKSRTKLGLDKNPNMSISLGFSSRHDPVGILWVFLIQVLMTIFMTIGLQLPT
ncbi:hypothetical protein ACFE04_018700 [Oxalis oulophora]